MFIGSGTYANLSSPRQTSYLSNGFTCVRPTSGLHERSVGRLVEIGVGRLVGLDVGRVVERGVGRGVKRGV